MISPDDVDRWLTGRTWGTRYGAAVEAELTGLLEAVLVSEAVPASQAHLIAVGYAKERSATLIAGVENTTKEAVRGLVSDTIAQGGTVQTLKQGLRAHGFGPSRATTIARTETTKSLRVGKREAAQTQGKDMHLWQTNSPDACDDCKANEDVGWISMDEDFPNGDDVHPNCECAVQYRTAALHEEGEE